MHHNPPDPLNPGSQGPPSSPPASDGRGGEYAEVEDALTLNVGDDPFVTAPPRRPFVNPAMVRSALLDALRRIEESPTPPPQDALDGQGNPNISNIRPPLPSALNRNVYSESTSEFYVVTCGTHVGIFDDWRHAQSVSFGVSNGCVESAKNWQAAVAKYRKAFEEDIVKLGEYKAKRKRALSAATNSVTPTPQAKKPAPTDPSPAPSPTSAWHGSSVNPICIHSNYVTPNRPPPKVRKRNAQAAALVIPAPTLRIAPSHAARVRSAPTVAPTATVPLAPVPEHRPATLEKRETVVVVSSDEDDTESEDDAEKMVKAKANDKGKAKVTEPKDQPPVVKAVPKADTIGLDHDIERRPRKFLIVELHDSANASGVPVQQALRSWYLIENLPATAATAPQTDISDVAAAVLSAANPSTPSASTRVSQPPNATAGPSNATAGPSTPRRTTPAVNYDMLEDSIDYCAAELAELLDNPGGVVFRDPKA